jgi:hypothetical protein
MRGLIRRLDAFLRRVKGVFEFCDAPDCLLRLAVGEAPRTLDLGNTVVAQGEPILELHLWNEHLPSPPPSGPDLTWATRLARLWVGSLRRAARYMRQDPRLAGVRAVRGVTVLIAPRDHPGGVHLMERLGFTVMPYRGPLGRFGEFWENLYTWGVMWAFNAVSLQGRQLIRLQRTEIWMPAEEFLRRYAG